MKTTLNCLLVTSLLAFIAAEGFAESKPKPPLIEDEFVGPFASWVNVKTECGAVGDGKADDTAAIQKGLGIINPADAKRKVLDIPAGAWPRALQILNEVRREL